MNRMELTVACQAIAKSINDTPYATTSDDAILTPNMMINPGRYLGRTTFEVNTRMENVKTMLSNIKNFVELFTEVRNQQIVIESSKYMEQRLKNSNKKVYEVEVGDLVFISDQSKFNDFIYGVVIDTEGSDAIINPSKGKIKYAQGLLKVMSPVSSSYEFKKNPEKST